MPSSLNRNGISDGGSLAISCEVLGLMTYFNEKIQPLSRVDFLLVAKVGNFNPPYQFHNEVRTSLLGRTSIIHFGDIRMVHSIHLPLSALMDKICGY